MGADRAVPVHWIWAFEMLGTPLAFPKSGPDGRGIFLLVAVSIR